MKYQKVWFDGACRFSLGGKVGKTEDVVLFYGILNQFDLGRQTGFVLGGEIDEHMSAARCLPY